MGVEGWRPAKDLEIKSLKYLGLAAALERSEEEF